MKKRYVKPYCDIYLHYATDVLNISDYNTEFDYEGSEWQ